jgi:hypothetical protein
VKSLHHNKNGTLSEKKINSNFSCSGLPRSGCHEEEGAERRLREGRRVLQVR